MSLELECVEWTNVNRNAKLLNKNKSKQANEECLYLTQIVAKEEPNELDSKLACLCSNQIVYVYDQAKLKVINQITYPHGNKKNSGANSLGFFKKQSNSMFTCGDDGQLKLWDLRTLSSEDKEESKCVQNFCDSNSAEFLCADINVDDNLLIASTNKVIDNSYIYLFDIRNSSKYLFKLSESHNGDVTQVRFDPSKPSKFISGGYDGLICLFDLDNKEEECNNSEEDDESDSEVSDPDFMYQCYNTMSSVQKLGYLNNDQLYALTLNGLFVYDLKTDDLAFKIEDLNKEAEEENESYFVNCLNWRFTEEPIVLTGTKNGNMKFYQKNNLLFEVISEDKTERKHRDVIRDSYCNSKNLYTVGEDGFLFKWNVNKKSPSKKEEKSNKKRDVSSDSKEVEKVNDKKRKKF